MRHSLMWHKIFFNAMSVQAETQTSVRIGMPSKSRYAGWCFWHPKSLVREQGGKGYHLTFSFHDEWVFKVKLYGKGRYNSRDVIREEELTPAQMFDAFGVVNENVNNFIKQETLKIIEKETIITEVEHHTPERVEPIESNIIDELKYKQ